MGKLLSFLGGAAQGFTSEVEKAEKSAKEEAMLRVKGLSENYKKTIEANRTLQNSMNEEKDWIKATYGDAATPEQTAFLLSSPASLEALKKMKDPTRVSLNDVISIASSNAANSATIERITALPEVADKVGAAIKANMPQYRSGLGGVVDSIAEGVGDTAAKQYARATGTDLETLQSTKRLERPKQAGTFAMGKVLQEVPKSMDEIVKAAEVERFQAKQQFGENSEQYKTANAKFVASSTEIVKADKKLEDRLGLRLVALQDETDPAKKAVLRKEVSTLQAAVKANREATSTDKEREPKEKTYSQTKMLMEDYLNTQMIEDRGLGWKKFMEPKTIKDPETGQTIVRLEKKVGLSPEAEQAVAEGMKKLRLQGLKDLGLVTESGAPRTPEVKNLITTYGLGAARPPAPPEAVPGVTTTPAPTGPVTALPAPAPKPAAAAQSAANVNQLRAEANAVIAKGADPVAVSKRFKQSTGQEL